MDETNLEFIIPAYNEEGCLGDAISMLRREFPYARLLVVDDGSTDGTAGLCKRKGIDCISIAHSGYGAAIREGFKSARGELLVIADADLPFEPSQLKSALGLMGGADLFLLERDIYSDSILRRALSRLYRRFALQCLPVRSLGGRELDVNSFKAVRKSALHGVSLDANGWIFGAELIHKFQKNNLVVVLGPRLKCIQRRNGRSNVSIVSVLRLCLDLVLLKAGYYG